MERAKLLEQLTKATDKAAQLVVQRGSKKLVSIGETAIEKNALGLYNILGKHHKQLYKDISVFDVAIIIAQRHNAGEFQAIRKILVLESAFSKYRTDMVHYLHCYKGAKLRRDFDKMYILEDKFQTAEQLAKLTRNSISIFKRVK